MGLPKRSSCKGFDLIYDQDISTDQMELVCENLSPDNSESDSPQHTTGRGAVRSFKIQRKSSPREIVIRKGRRGGMVACVISSLYFILPHGYPERSRMWEEFHILSILRKAGVRVPEPVFAAVRRRAYFWYEGFLGTFLICGAENFLDYAMSSGDEMKLYARAYEAGEQAKRMLQAGVYHEDLHLGNVMVSSSGAYLIDFDKAVRLSPGADDFSHNADRLVKRWERSLVRRFSSPSKRDVLLRGFRGGLLCP